MNGLRSLSWESPCTNSVGCLQDVKGLVRMPTRSNLAILGARSLADNLSITVVYVSTVSRALLAWLEKEGGDAFIIRAILFALPSPLMMQVPQSPLLLVESW